MKYIFLLVLLFFSFILHAQESPSSPLYKILKQRDSLVFNVAFNQCNLAPYDTIISHDVEFYHDVGGITNGKEAFITSAKNNICGGKNKMKRELVDSSLKVFPLFNNKILYGAIQEGFHKFYVFENDQWKYTGAAKFTHLWLLEKGVWKLKRVLSYDHK